jgi:hypothetical protein
MQTKSEVKNVSSIPVVSEFPDVFPETLPGLPPRGLFLHRNPGTAPISRAPYRMDGVERTQDSPRGVNRSGRSFDQVHRLGGTGFVCEEEGWKLALVH